MNLIVGLGNPGKKYVNSRHNLGFKVVDDFGRGLVWQKSKDLMCDFAKNKHFIVIKPTTFMNLSGQSVKAVANFYKIKAKEILVIHDEVDLELGKIRLAFDGSSAGHNGIESIIKSLSTEEFNRLRMGVGHPSVGQVEDYVLKDFKEDELEVVEKMIKVAVEATSSFLADGVGATMNRFN